MRLHELYLRCSNATYVCLVDAVERGLGITETDATRRLEAVLTKLVRYLCHNPKRLRQLIREAVLRRPAERANAPLPTDHASTRVLRRSRAGPVRGKAR